MTHYTWNAIVTIYCILQILQKTITIKVNFHVPLVGIQITFKLNDIYYIMNTSELMVGIV